MNYSVEKLIFFIVLLLCLFIVLLLFFLIYFIVFSKKDIEKIASYECGFHPYQDRRITFSVSFYLIAIVFLVFDLEYIYIFALIYVFRDFGHIVYYALFFFFLFFLCFLYEWFRDTFKWKK